MSATRRWRRTCRNRKSERRTRTFSAFGGDGAIVRVHDLFNDSETKTCAFLLRVAGRSIKNLGQQLERGEKCLRTYIAMPVREELENPSLAAAHFRLGTVLERKGDYPGARAEYETALKIDPKQKLAREALVKLKR